MSLFQALIYFFREAAVNLVRGWKVSLLAILTITVSLFLGGVFLLASENLRSRLDQWRDESRLVVYLDTGVEAAARQRVRALIETAPALVEVQIIEPDEASERFLRAFPSLADLLEGWGEEPLPASFEVRLDWSQVEKERFDPWLQGLSADVAVTMVDDDRDWLEQLEAAVIVLEGLAFVLGLVLLATAVFTISSVIRLTAYLYHDEIAVMRLVGATEFFIRGPFYIEGFLQGLGGGLLATGLLAGGHRLLTHEAGDVLVASMLIDRFLSPGQLVALVALGAGAGLLGAIVSLRRENLGATAENPEEWAEQE
ncbi:MAG: permease-like cell division protein FtsX [Acidobacteriota bacterium]